MLRFLLLQFPWIGAAMVLCSSAAAAQPARQDPMNHPACRGLQNTFACARAIEGQVLAQRLVAAERAGDTLVVHLASDAVLQLGDEQSDTVAPRGPERAAYSLLGRLERLPYYLLHAQYGEGNDYALVHTRTGRITFVPGWPVESPDGRWLLFAESGYFNEFGVFLYQAAGDSVARVWTFDPEGWAPGQAVWRTTSTAEVDRIVGGEVGPGPERVAGTLKLRYEEGRWNAVGP